MMSQRGQICDAVLGVLSVDMTIDIASGGACGADEAQRMPLQAVLNTFCSGTVCAMCVCERDAEDASDSM